MQQVDKDTLNRFGQKWTTVLWKEHVQRCTLSSVIHFTDKPSVKPELHILSYFMVFW